MEAEIFKEIEPVLVAKGYKILEGDHHTIYVKKSKKSFSIKVEKLD